MFYCIFKKEVSKFGVLGLEIFFEKLLQITQKFGKFFNFFKIEKKLSFL